MSSEAQEDVGQSEQGEDAAELANVALLEFCKENKTQDAIRLIEQGADPSFEDVAQWSPLIWAASHGNEELVSYLIQRGAADIYRYEGPRGGAKWKKHSPLHWAAFKGHHRVLWLLMAPEPNLPHHAKDSIGNTPLHEAAAGGSLHCIECLMARGVDIFAKNDRGHTPFALCTIPESQAVLQRAMTTTSCKVTGKQFSSNVLRYLCLWTLDVFSEAAVTQQWVYETPAASERRKPVTWCIEVRDMIQHAEQQLTSALHLDRLDELNAALAVAEGKPVDCKLIDQCLRARAKLESEILLGNAMQVQTITNLEDFGSVHEALSMAIENAERKRADPARVAWAKALRRKQMAEASLIRAIQGPQKVIPNHIQLLEDLTRAAQGEHANSELLGRAEKLITRLKSELEVQRCIDETAPLCDVSSFKECAGKENLPPWYHDTQLFEDFHEDYKRIVEIAERDAISSGLMTRALGQLQTIEQLLVERKNYEAEQQLKNSKKRGKKK
mmetsp:Transcript_2764/g.6456  ORF Transcript_2764/g.6456 Transcript_2764/m.6456 type:complete len:499 (-) Transcript_2764:84-1580(-)|eukprot:CAMPEP_0171102328 /NCGR_PEP_ID=MMETSP0766_2-20121228/57501_1 /TAXON_ID=439317 /ORGANISM="Gambierdiscus australes, Strain CAWD 149" /LENGTH=498 /DNA_ID=CAMNT_0011562585 /DNA_START=39 /DNA_END=1535 /DNA_ORIENTATION=+